MNLLHLRARWYDVGTGTFLSRDPVEGIPYNPNTLNGYNYAHQNPINLTDQSGLSPLASDPFTACMQLPFCPPLLASGGKVLAVTLGPTVGVIVAVPTILGSISYYFCGINGCIVQSPVQPLPAPAPPRPFPDTTPVPERTGTGEDPLSLPSIYQAPKSKPGSTPEPKPNPTPWRIEDPASPTCTPEHEEKHISLGFANVGSESTLFYFTLNLNTQLNPQKIFVYANDQWVQAGLAKSLRPFSAAFDEASKKAKEIHFNLEGIKGVGGVDKLDPYNSFAKKFGSNGNFGPGAWYTADELYLIKTRSLCSKTRFYEDGSVSTAESMTAWQVICGQ